MLGLLEVDFRAEKLGEAGLQELALQAVPVGVGLGRDQHGAAVDPVAADVVVVVQPVHLALVDGLVELVGPGVAPRLLNRYFHGSPFRVMARSSVVLITVSVGEVFHQTELDLLSTYYKLKLVIF